MSTSTTDFIIIVKYVDTDVPLIGKQVNTPPEGGVFTWIIALSLEGLNITYNLG